jgi:hypothetical protein
MDQNFLQKEFSQNEGDFVRPTSHSPYLFLLLFHAVMTEDELNGN